MSCNTPLPIYIPHSKEGINLVTTLGDGYSIALDWTQAYSDSISYNLAYNVYFSTTPENVFTEGVKVVSIDPAVLAGTLLEFTPGDVFYFAIRATEFSPTWYDLNFLPDSFPGFKSYPESALLTNITPTSTLIKISDVSLWPTMGIIQIGNELVRYTSKDIPNNNLFVAERGFLSTTASLHHTDGYDGVEFQDPILKFFKGYEEQNTVVLQATSTFKDSNYAFTVTDGYRITTKDNLTTDLSVNETDQINFISMDFSGWRRTDPVALLKGECIGTYYGGERFCADGYGVGFQLRGLPFEQESDRRLEELLSIEGQKCVLVKRFWKGLTCSCFEPSHENPQLRCSKCYGTGFVTGYEQFFNPRESDGRIWVKFDPTEDSVKINDQGLESTFLPNSWTLSVPTVKNRDFLIRFNLDGTEEYRYEVLDVTRNVLLNSFSGAQKFKLQRLRKSDPIYQWRTIRSTATIPTILTTSIGLLRGPNNTSLPHTHTVTISENIVSLGQINQTTSVTQGHNHSVINGVIQEVAQHSHILIYP